MRRHDKIPRQVFDLALARAQAMASERRSVMGVGFGFKWRDDSGYGRTPKPCIKFVVRRKREASEREHLPKSITVTYEGRPWRVLTDVEVGGGLREHANSTCRILYKTAKDGSDLLIGHPGACGFFVRAAGDVYLVTAGHVCLRPGAGSPEADDVLVTGAFVGTVEQSLTYRMWDGEFYDVGVSKVTAACPQRTHVPHSRMRRCLSAQVLISMWQRHEHPEFTVYAPGEQFSCQFDAAWQFSLDLKVENKIRTYGSVLFTSTARAPSRFQPGQSGSPIMYGENIVGFHFLGYGDSSLKSFGISADSILTLLSREMNTAVDLDVADG